MKNFLKLLDRPRIRKADTLRDQERWAEATSVYREIVRRRPERAGVWLQLGHCLRKLGQPDEALIAYRQAVHYRPDHADTVFHIAATLHESGNKNEANKLYESAILLFEAHPPVGASGWLQFAQSLYHLDRFEAALAACLEADRRQQNDPHILFQLANIHRDLGQLDDAERCFRRVLEFEHAPIELLNVARLRCTQDAIPPGWLDHIVLGTTGTCNASCVHCPTGKGATAHSPRQPMPMSLFRKIIDEVTESKLPVASGISFGLFGDGLVDPFVVERARYLRERMPDVPLSVNTNGAAYDPARHAELNDYVSTIALHCESLTPETYNYLMQPLRAERVHIKYPMILRDFPRKVLVSVPVNQMNISERPNILDYFHQRGAANVVFSPMSNRLGFDDAVFERLAFDPGPVTCQPQILRSLIVDCDGTVLACCQDFSRVDPVGNLVSETLAETLVSPRRLSFHDQLSRSCHKGMPTCRNCRADFVVPPMEHDCNPLIEPPVLA